MVYKISTTGIVSEVVLHDLGARTIVHPTTDLDLGLEYTEHELNNSNDLKEAISLAWIVIEDSVQLDDSRYYKQEDINYIVNNIDHNSLQNLDYDEHRFVSTSLSTGLLKGGRLSVNEEDRSKFNIEEGVGVIVDNYSDSTNPVRKIVHWPSISGIQCDYISDYEWSAVCITRIDYGDGLGTVVQFPEFILSNEDRRDLISIGSMTHISTNEISYADTEVCFIGDPVSQLWDFVFNFGSFNIEGNEYGCSGLLKLKKSGGETYAVGTNYGNTSKSPNVWVSLDEDPVSEIIYYYREQGEWVNSDITTDLVDPNMYDSGDGLLPVTTSGWTIQTIFFYAPWNTTEIQYGQRVYDSQQEALSALSERIDINPWISEYDTFRGWLVVKQGAETIDCESESVIVHAHKLGTVSSAVGGSGSGEINIASNAGLTGVSLVLPKDGVTLPFKSITATDQIITVSGNDTEKSVDIGVDESKISHSNISDLNSDSHSQYLNSTRGDTRYYTKVSLDGGQLDNRYYTEFEVDTISGSLDAKMLYVNGEKELIGDWDAGSYSIKAGGFYFGDARLDTAIFACATGSLTGGSISKCPEDETKIHVEAGTSLYVDMTDRTNPIVEILSWDDEHFYPSISGVDTKWVGIQRTAPGVGGIVVSNKFSQLEKRFITILGRCWNFSGTDVIEGTGNYKAGAFNNDKTIQDLAYALGTINIYGNTYYTTTSGVMRLSRSYGEAFRFSANYDNSAVSPNIYNSLTVEDIDYYTYHLFGTFSVPKTDIDCDYYDDNGVRTAIPTDKWTIQRVYYYPVSNITSMTYGQHIYDSYEDAYANMFTESVNLNRGTMQGTALRAYLIVKQGCDDLTDTSKAVLFEAGSIGAFAGGSSGGGGVTDHGALEGLGDDDHKQYILHNGTRDFSGPVKYSYNPTFNNEAQLITKKYVDDIISGLTTDHGELTGLSDDDHPQYHNDARGDARYYTQEQVDTISGSLSSLVAIQTALATVQLDRTTSYTIGTTWGDVSFDTISYENFPDILERDDTNTERILVKETGTYSFSYGVVVQANTTTTYTYGRLVRNGTTEISASDAEIRTYQNERHELTGSVTADVTAGTYVTLQLMRSSEGTVTGVHARFNAIKLDGVKGEKGDKGDQGPQGIITVSGTAYFDAYDSAGTLTLNSSWQDVPFNVVRKNSGEFTFTGDTELTIPSSTTYYITARVSADITNGVNRSESIIRLVKDTGSGYVEVPGSRGALYHRLLGEGSNTATVNILDDFSTGDKIKVQITQDSGLDTIALLANGSSLSVHIPAGATGPQGLPGVDAGGTMAVIQVRRTTQYTNIPLSWVDLIFDTTDVEYDDTVLEHDDVNRDRILIKRTGYYWIGCHFTVDDEARCRIRVNDTTVISGSDRQSGDINDTNQIITMMANPVIAQLTAGDFITVQIQATTSDEFIFEGATLIVFELLGAKGDKGDPGTPGSGSTINVYGEGSPVANTPHSLLNFTGSGVSVSDVDGDQINISIPGSTGFIIQEEGSTVTGGPHGTINFIGNSVTASNAGSGVANVTVAPIFGSQFSSAVDESETNTNSTSPVTKVTLSVTGIPAGNYRIGWYYEWRRNSTSNRYRATVVIDGTTTIMEHDQESQDVNNFHTNSGFYIGSLSSGNHTIVLGHYGNTTGSTSYTRVARLEIWRVS